MSTNVGAVDFELLLNSNPFNKGLKDTTNTIKSSGIENSLKKIGKLAVAAFSVKAIVNFGKECIDLGSDLTEVQNVVDVTFGSLNTEVNRFAENTITQFGLGQTVTKKYVGTFGAMAKAFNFSNKEALAMSETLTGLTGDVASFYNLSSDEAYTKLKSVFTGETETLKDLGVVMTQNALDQYALANGYGKTTSKMSEQEKVALRYKFVLDKLNIANGDFARTSDSWANQTRVLGLRFNELKATLGQGFINIFTPIVKGINMVLSKLQVLANAFKSFTEMIFGNAGGDDSLNAVSNLASDAAKASDAVSGIGDSAKKTKKDLLGLRGIDEINNLTTSSDDSSSSGSGVGGKIDTSGLNLTDNLKKQASDIGNILNGVNLEPLKQSFNNLKEAISYFGQGCGKILDGFYNNYLKPLGNYVISDALPHFLNSTANAMKSIDFDKLESAFNELWKSLEPFHENIGNGLLWFYDNVLLKLATWTINEVVPAFLKILKGSIDVTNKAIEDIKPIWKWFWDKVLSPITTWTGGVIVDVLNGVGDALKWISDNEVAMSIIEGVAIAIGLVTGALTLYNIAMGVCNVVTGIFAGIMAILTSPITIVIAIIGALIAAIILCVKHWDQIKETAKNCWEGIKNAWNNAGQWFNEKIVTPIKNFFGNLWNNIKNTASGAWQGIKSVWYVATNWFNNTIVNPIRNTFGSLWSGLKNGASGAWQGIKNVFGNVASWFGNIFSNAWNAVKNVFSVGGRIFDGIQQGIANTFRNIVNSLIRGINRVVSIPFNSINTALRMIRNATIAGFQPFSWLPSVYVPHIPYLAQGGYVKANTPQLAMIGDNRHQGEVVAPEDKLHSIMSEELSKFQGNGNNSEVISLLKEILKYLRNSSGDTVLNIDNIELARTVIKGMKALQAKSDKPILDFI
jgi:hypothetical protein